MKRSWKYIIGSLLIPLVLILLLSAKPQNPNNLNSPTPSVTVIASRGSVAGVESSGGPCISVNGKPDHTCTPGAANPNVTQANIGSTICVSGYTTTIRPSTTYTNKLKAQQIKEYGYIDTNLSSYEEDHLIPLELGGDPTNSQNLWPEPYNVSDNNGAASKDKIENLLHKEVCSGQISLQEAQNEISTNWEGLSN